MDEAIEALHPYLTLSDGDAIVTEIEIQRSRFICTLFPAVGETAAREGIAEVRRTYATARHNCTAFRVRDEHSGMVAERSSDDGEPAGTAGGPMLAVLRGTEWANVCAVVTRYFGGIKLGTGGLVRAYSDTVTASVEAARAAHREVQQRPVELWDIPMSYSDVGRWEADIRHSGWDVVEVDYSAAHTVNVRVATDSPANTEQLQTYVAALTGGVSEPQLTGREWRAYLID